jgi:hypothetical protein
VKSILKKHWKICGFENIFHKEQVFETEDFVPISFDTFCFGDSQDRVLGDLKQYHNHHLVIHGYGQFRM